MPNIKLFVFPLWLLSSTRPVFAPHWNDMQLSFKYPCHFLPIGYLIGIPFNVADNRASSAEYHFQSIRS
jgi:hypothetical protein